MALSASCSSLKNWCFYFIQYIKTDEYVFIVFEPVGSELVR